MAKLIVIEVNEIPINVINYYANLKPKSCISGFVASGHIKQTIAEDLPEDLLYPSQAWASVEHGEGIFRTWNKVV